MEMTLKDKKIVLGVSAGISAYKAAEVLRALVRDGADVFVAMSANAGRFVTPLTFQALSGNPVYSEVFGSPASASMEHIRAAENADLMVVAPATANCIAKLANGHADDALSTLFLAFDGPAVVAPAMNDKMYANPAVRENIAKLKSRGVVIVEPETGELACGAVGVGRLAEPLRIVEEVEKRLSLAADLAGLRLLVTAGPTREPIDPVRYITNPSSGKMGYAIAEQARDRGAVVVLISGPTHLPQPGGVEFLPCLKASEMLDLVLARLPECDALVMTAAVGDFAPESIHKEKIKKRGEPLVLKLNPTPDILLEAAKIKTRQFMVGFAAESQNLVQSALEKFRKKRLDLIVANDISAPGIGFQSDYNQVTVIAGESDIERLPLLPKTEVAGVILDRIKAGVTAK
ncbi:MAG: bifunctional phosphopantothenoylcysteine decarboxylase/phosphopantothenate--cysteine ligase CoaBC [Nitrospinae bacterium]|nr:bifunctional phosphopantothenoylcysteine decarboxylase/phosphopantothenate--cysteine ligase CoaBC [Nitrospinota bacterium]